MARRRDDHGRHRGEPPARSPTTTSRRSCTCARSVTNDNGGTALATAWTLTANGTGSNDLSGSTPVDSGTGLLADTWTLSESGPAGYAKSDWVCEGGTYAKVAGVETITVGIGGSATCTITNNDIPPQLHLRKDRHQRQRRHGPGHRLDPDRQRHRQQRPLGLDPGRLGYRPAGRYLDAQSSPVPPATPRATGSARAAPTPRWPASRRSRSASVARPPARSPTTTSRRSCTCARIVTNDNGGTALATDWTLTANGTGSNDLSGTTPVDSGTGLLADTWTLSESGPAGYAKSDWVCEGGTYAKVAGVETITVGIGGSATCTITNNDIPPQLHLRKVVTNDNGGTAPGHRLDPDGQRHRHATTSRARPRSTRVPACWPTPGRSVSPVPPATPRATGSARAAPTQGGRRRDDPGRHRWLGHLHDHQRRHRAAAAPAQGRHQRQRRHGPGHRLDPDRQRHRQQRPLGLDPGRLGCRPAGRYLDAQ